MKKLFNSYLELGLLNHFMIIIILNILLKKLFLYLGVKIKDAGSLVPKIGILT
jgi:hypothetical protein|tara:strand:+ start:3698 stop:3856 length:159 start_codon:yes stop_codon:yes gene_type:complete